MATDNNISVEKLRELLNYCQETGEFTWKRESRKGMAAGTLHRSGFLRLNLLGQSYYLQRLAWLWVNREFPKTGVIHLNGVRTDNRISNLREGTKSVILLEYIRSSLIYSEELGEFTWVADGSTLVVSKTKSGYIKACLLGKFHYVHRLAWLWVHGQLPDGQIDHVNRNKSDNRLSNLRDVSGSENCQNRLTGAIPGAQRGVNGSWETAITFRGRRVRVTGFTTPEEASEMHIELKRRLHDTYTHTQNGYGSTC